MRCHFVDDYQPDVLEELRRCTEKSARLLGCCDGDRCVRGEFGIHRADARAYQRIVRVVVDERGRRRRAQLYVQPEEDLLRWMPAAEYFAVILRAYMRLGFDRQRLAQAITGGPT